MPAGLVMALVTATVAFRAIARSPAGVSRSVTKVWIWLRWAMRTGGGRRKFGVSAPRMTRPALAGIAGAHDRPAMHAGERPALAQHVEILADGLRGDVEPVRQVLDAHPAERPRDVEDFRLPPRNIHFSPIRKPIVISIANPAALEGGQ